MECSICLANFIPPKLSVATRKTRNDLKKTVSSDTVWMDSCAVSVCKLLELEEDVFKPMFTASHQCPSCKQLLRDVDFFVRRAEKFNTKLAELRVTVASNLFENMKIWGAKNTTTVSTSTQQIHPNEVLSLVTDPGIISTLDPVSSEINVKSDPDDDDTGVSTASIQFDQAHSIPISVKKEEDDMILNQNNQHWDTDTENTNTLTVLDLNSDPRAVGSTILPGLGETGQPATEIPCANKDTHLRRSLRKRKTVFYLSEGWCSLGTSAEDPAPATQNANSDSSSKQLSGKVSKRKTIFAARNPKSTQTKQKIESESEFDPTEEEDEEGDDDPCSESDVESKGSDDRYDNGEAPRKRGRGGGVGRRYGWRSDLSLTIKFLLELEGEENLTYVCKNEDCSRRFLTLKDLKAHKVEDHSKHLEPVHHFQCPFCSVLTAFGRELDAHILRKHQKQEYCYICPLNDCPYKAKTSNLFLRHMTRRHPDYPIPEAELLTNNAKHLHRDKLLVGCPKAQILTRKRKIRHQAKGQGQEQVQGQGRRQNQTPRSRMPCHVADCKFYCYNQLALDAHNRKVHLNDSHPYKCTQPNCGKQFSSLDTYRTHLKLMHDIGKAKIVNCLFCNFRTDGGRGNLNLHMREKHATNDAPKFFCRICGLLFFTSEDSGEHEELHSAKSRNDCVIRLCEDGLGFVTLEELRGHVKVKHNERHLLRKICHICGAVLGWGRDFNRHLRTHDPTHFPYKCRYCDKSFKIPQNRESHEEIIHSDKTGNTYNCKQCDATFTARQYLYKHTSWHKHGANANIPIARKKLL